MPRCASCGKDAPFLIMSSCDYCLSHPDEAQRRYREAQSAIVDARLGPDGEPFEIRCRFCAEKVLSTAVKCKHCGEWLSIAPASVGENVLKREGPDASGVLVTLGSLLLVGGLVFLFYVLSQDTSVATEYGGRVQNLGLMNEKQNLIIVSAAVSVLGAILLVAGGASGR